jgi:3',5'-cyclic AMP phosphodiesterase CpdA
MATRVLHLSDLHLGSRGSGGDRPGLAELIARKRPELIVVSGDLSHRGRRGQLEQAASFLRSLGPPLLAVPGNHDLPYTLPGRFSHPWREFERQWGSTEPIYRSESLIAVGLNSARPWRHQSGQARSSSLRRAATLLAETPADVFRLVILHHHLANAPWRSRKRPLWARGRVLAALAEAGADLICSGHIHQGAVWERHEFQVDAGERSLIISTAPGLGRPRPRRRGEAQGFQLYSYEAGAISIETYVWRSGELALSGERRFMREPPRR